MKLVPAGILAALSIGGLFMTPPALAQQRCKPGFVWRNAFPGDAVCVTVQARQQAADDNAVALSRREPNGGAYGPDTCRVPYVWRMASPADHVCASTRERDLTAQDNAAAASRVAAAAPTVSSYRVSPWSQWTRVDDVEYRYQWGWNPQDRKYATEIDAIFEIHNRTNAAWVGSARSINCTSNTLGGSAPDVTLRPHETRRVVFMTTNCGTHDRPYFKPGVARSNTL